MQIIRNLNNELKSLIMLKAKERSAYIDKHIVTINCPLHLFIDGNHLYKNSKDDLSEWLPHLESLHKVAPTIEELSTPEVMPGEDQYAQYEQALMFRGDREYWESQNNDFKYSKEKHLEYCGLFLTTSVNLIEKDISSKLIRNLLDQKKIKSEEQVINNIQYNNLINRIFDRTSFFMNDGSWYIDFFSYAFDRFSVDKQKKDDCLNKFKDFLKIVKKVPDFKNLSFMGLENEKYKKFWQYFEPNEKEISSQKRFLEVLKHWNPIEDLKYLEKTNFKSYRINFSTEYKLYKGSLRSDRLLNSLNYIENTATKTSTKQWCRENKRLISNGKLLWNERNTKPSSITYIHDFYLALKKLYKKNNFQVKDRITKWDIVGNEGYYRVVPEEKGVDTALSNDVIKELYKGDDKIICIITNDTDFTSTLIDIEEAEKNNDGKIKETYLCSAYKKSRIPKELKSFNVNFVFPKDNIGHLELAVNLWPQSLPDYSYLVSEDSKKIMRQNMENSIYEYKKAIEDMEKIYEQKRKALELFLKSIEEIYSKLKDSRIN